METKRFWELTAMSNITIEITLTANEVKEAVEEHVHRKYGSKYVDMQPCSREVTVLDDKGALVVIEKDDV